jgi:hypothetical protein
MEWLTIALSSLLTILAPVGLILDTVVADRLRSQVTEIEQLAVRIDNVPNYQVLEGKVKRIRIASRGIYPIPNLRIAALELESDPIDINLERLQQGGKNSLTEALRRPAQAAVRLEIKEADINNALQSSEIKTQLQKLIDKLAPNQEEINNRFELVNINLEFLPDNRIRTQIKLQQSNLENRETQPLEIILEVGLNLVNGRSLELVKPTGSLNGKKLSTRLLNGFAEGLNEKLDLRTLEKRGILIRVLQFNIDDQSLNLATFIRVNPQAQL